MEVAKGATLLFLVFILWCISMGWLRWNLWDLAGGAGGAGGTGRDGEDLASAPAGLHSPREAPVLSSQLSSNGRGRDLNPMISEAGGELVETSFLGQCLVKVTSL